MTAGVERAHMNSVHKMWSATMTLRQKGCDAHTWPSSAIAAHKNILNSAGLMIKSLIFCQLLCCHDGHGHSGFAHIGACIVHGVDWSRRLCARQACSDFP